MKVFILNGQAESGKNYFAEYTKDISHFRSQHISTVDPIKEFLEIYGALGIYDNFISGIIDNNPLEVAAGGIYGDTIVLREDFDDIPKSLWVISKHEDGAYCLDTSNPTQNGEFAIVNCEYGYNGKPNVVAKNFSDFLCKQFLEGWANNRA